MGMWTRGIAGVVLCLVGLVWIGQGANLIGGSFMSGERLWLGIGCGCVVIGLALLWWARSRRGPGPRRGSLSEPTRSGRDQTD